MRKKSFVKQLIIFSLLIAMAVSLSACKKVVFTMGIEENELMKIGDDLMSKGEGTFAFLKGKADYEASFGNEIWDQKINDTSMLNYLKENVKEKLIEMRTIGLLGKSLGIKLDATTQANAEAMANEWISKHGEEQLLEYSITNEEVIEYFKDYLFEKKVYDSIISDVKIDLSDSKTKVIDVMYIYFGNDEDSETKAKEAKKRLDKGEDFQALAKEVSKDSKYEMSFGRDEAYPEFEEAAFALKDGEISDIVKTENGYYIIKCVEDYMMVETLANREKIESNIKKEAMEELYVPFVKDLSVEFDNSYWKSLK